MTTPLAAASSADLNDMEAALNAPQPFGPEHTDLPVQIEPTPARRLAVFFAALLALLVAQYLTVTRPMMGRIETLTTQFATAQSQLDALAGSRTDAWRTNDLLTALAIQQDRMREAELATGRIEELADSVASVGARTDAALDAVDRLEHLEDRIATAAVDVDALVAAVDEVEQLHRRIDGLSADADTRMVAVADAAANLSSLGELKNRLVAQGPSLVEAEAVANASEDLVADLLAAAPRVRPARQSAEDLISLAVRDESEAASTEAAESAIARMQDVRGSLATAGDELLAARQELEASQNLFDGTIDAVAERQSEQLAGLIESSELMVDFHRDLVSHLASLRSVRRQLVDLATLETTFTKLARSLQPLATLANLRYLSVDEMRLAADAIRRDRDNIPSVLADEPITPMLAERLVPEPIDGPVMR